MTDDQSPQTSAAERSAAVSQAIQAFQAGIDREESFRLLHKTFFPPVRRFFLRKGLPPEECLDLTQETFLGIYRGLYGYRHEARFETWLYRIATTAYLKRLRSSATDKRAGQETTYIEGGPHDVATDERKDPLAALVDGERRRAMRQAIRRLPDQMRMCLTLRLYHELKYREIASVMRIKIDTVKAHLFQARKRLMADLGPLPFESARPDADST